MAIRKNHYVVFLSPGSFVSESSSRPIQAWDSVEAAKLAKGITERHGATPYGFYFETRLESDPIPDGEGGELKVLPRTVAKSGMYYINGEVLRFSNIPATKEFAVLRDNMRGNRHPVAVQTGNGYRHTDFFEEKDCVVNREGEVTTRGDSPELVRYREKQNEEFEKYWREFRAAHSPLPNLKAAQGN